MFSWAVVNEPVAMSEIEWMLRCLILNDNQCMFNVNFFSPIALQNNCWMPYLFFLYKEARYS